MTMFFQMFVDLFTGGPPDPSNPDRTVLNPLWIAEQSQLNSSFIDSSRISTSVIETPSYFDFSASNTFKSEF